MNGRFYIGYSESPERRLPELAAKKRGKGTPGQSPERRLAEHNAGKVKSTKPYRPWKKCIGILWIGNRGNEKGKALKAMKSRIYIQTLIDKTRPD
ncbi:MAG: hypothetical protein IPK96_03640 [Flammeovirgaceae bacterium]|nr:hypothetical protein [Flammeovirgaceae bacterium]